MLQHFSLQRVNRAPASFDPEKLMAFQARAMQKVPLNERVEKVVPFLQRAGLGAAYAASSIQYLASQILAAAGDRIKVAGDILDYDDFFTPDAELAYDEKALEKQSGRATVLNPTPATS